MNWEATIAVIAVIALLVSIGTARFSYHLKLKTQHRQRMFEVSLVKIQSLESAKKETSRISGDTNRTMNEWDLSGSADTGQDYKEMICKCCSRAVDEFKAVRHNLNKTEADAFDSKITMYEKLIFDTMEQGRTPTTKQIQNLAMIPGELEVLIDTAIKDLQEEMAIE